MDATDPRARLTELAAAHGVSLAGLSALLGRNPSYLQQFVRKGSPRKLEETDRRTLARFFGVDEGQLGAPAVDPAATGEIAGADPGRWVRIPRLEVGASAGSGAFDGREVPIGHLGFEPGWFRRQGLVPSMLSAIEVDGDSMEPTLRDGDEILVDRTPREWRPGIHVLRSDGALLVKRLKRAAGDRIRILSDNPAYPSWECPRGEIEIVGRVVWKGGRL